MPLNLYVHLSWTTDGRLPMIGSSEDEFLRAFLPAEAKRQGADVAAIGVVSNHLHLVIRLPGVFNIPRLVQGLKGASARLMNQDSGVSRNGIKWAKGYDLRSVSPGHLNRAIRYVAQQAAHHPRHAIPSD
ncbi:MAG: transposase [Gemmatimonadetes bacterium]|nr:transposase [Gemmatimonadota bacterium]